MAHEEIRPGRTPMISEHITSSGSHELKDNHHRLTGIPTVKYFKDKPALVDVHIYKTKVINN